MSEDKILKLYPLTEKKKKMIFCKIYKYKDKIFNIQYLKKELPRINSLDDIKIDKLLSIDIDKYYKCLFLESNFCWISYNTDGKQRYFTKRYITYALDIYDLLSIYFNCKYTKVYDYISMMGYNFANVQIEKHNGIIISSIIESSPDIKDMIGDKIDIYYAMNDFNKKHKFISNNHYIFFVSVRYLKVKYHLNYSISTINQTINLYKQLGLIDKIEYEETGNLLSDKYVKKQKSLNKNLVSVYSLPIINSNVEYKMNNKATFLNKNHIQYYNLSKTNSHECDNDSLIYNKCNDIFNRYLYKKKVVAKEWIRDEIYQENISDSLLNKIWNKIIKNCNSKGRSIKPNNRIKRELKLVSNLSVFICN